MNRWRYCSLIIYFEMISFVFCFLALAQENKEQELLNELVNNSTNISSLYADFNQVRILSALSMPLRSQGILCFSSVNEQLNSLLWEYTSPVVHGFYLKSGKNLIWSQSRTQQASPKGREGSMLKEMGEQVAKLIRLDTLNMKANYQIKVNIANLVLELVPKKSELFASINLFFQPDKKKLQRLLLTEPNGDSTELNFINIRLNEPLPDICQP